GVAVDHRDGGTDRALDALEHRGHPGLGVGGLALLAAHLLQVHARAEGLAGPAHDDHPDVLAIVQLVEEPAQAVEHGGVHGVALLGTVERQGRDTVGDLAQDLVSHGLLSSTPPEAWPSYARP